MHDILSPANMLDRRVVESPDMLGKTCASCRRVLAYTFFDRDSSSLDGRRHQCSDCESQPLLSTSEHISRLKEMNLDSSGTQKQWLKDQLDYMCYEARIGHQMHSSEFLIHLRALIGSDRLFLTDGNFLGDIAVFHVSGVPRPDFDGIPPTFKYLWYIPTGWMPEYSLYEFDERLIPVREQMRGWRTPLLRLIKQGLVNEDRVGWEFGSVSGPASVVWSKELFRYRNRRFA